jgi:hypothetical protein
MTTSPTIVQSDRRTHCPQRISPTRLIGFSFGVGTQAMFAVTVVGLFSFLRYGQVPSTESWALVDTLLALQFAIPHSLLLHPSTRRRLRSIISAEFYGAFFCVCTCISLSLIFRFWRSTNTIVWDLNGIGAQFIIGAFYLSWAGMLYSISLTGLGFQTGWTQWQYWYRGEKLPRRDFEARGAYRVMRHPVYLCFLGLIWFTPKMTVDHALLTGIWTIYIGLGSILKDQRLSFYLGDSYRLMISGPLARRPAGTRERFHDDSGIVVRFSPERVLAGLDESTQQRAA